MSVTTNLLGEEASLFAGGIEGWTDTLNCTLGLALRKSPIEREVGSGTYQNAMIVASAASGTMTVTSDQFSVTAGKIYSAHVLVASSTPASATLSFNFYDGSSVQVPSGGSATYLELTGYWRRITLQHIAPTGAAGAEIGVSWETAAAGETHYLARPTVMAPGVGTAGRLALEEVPDYILDEDGKAGTGAPFYRLMGVMSYPFEEVTDGIISWDYLRATDAADGVADLSSLTDPLQADPDWLPWLASLVGVSPVSIGGSNSPWAAFDEAGIDTWPEWEGDIVVGGTTDDTTWQSIERFAEGTFSVTSTYRAQISSTYNGIAAGRAETIKDYLSRILENVPEGEIPWVFVRKHYKGNPYKILAVVRTDQDPDPDGDLLAVEGQEVVPLGTTIYVGHDVGHSALHLFDAAAFVSAANLDTTIASVTALAPPLIAIEDDMGRGRHIALGSYPASGADAGYGSGILNARQIDGFGLYSGAVEAKSGGSLDLDITGDIELRVLLSDFPNAGTLGTPDRVIATIGDATSAKCSLAYGYSAGTLTFAWTNSAASALSAVSTSAFPWNAGHPFWVSIALDSDVGASAHQTSFYYADTEAGPWTQAGTAVTGAGVTDLLETGSDTCVTLFSKEATKDSAQGILYRFKVWDDLADNSGTLVFDADLSDDQATLLTGTSAFTETVSNLGVSVSGATASGDWSVSKWLVLPYSATPWFYFGNRAAGAGDVLAVSGMPNSAWDYTVTYLDGSTASASMGTTTSYSFSASNANFGGKAITGIVVTSGAVTGASFVPASVFSASPAVTAWADSQTRNWTLTRLHDTANEYEFSSYVDRSIIYPASGVGYVFTDYGLSFSRGITVGVTYQRFWSGGSDEAVIWDQRGTNNDGIFLRLVGSELRATVYGVPYDKTLVWDESAAGQIGEWNTVYFRYDPANSRADLVVNGVIEDEEEGLAYTSFADRPTKATVLAPGTLKDFQFTQLALYDRAVSDDLILT